jgi:putative pyruvate formate lyase activating enzyme
MFRQVGPMRVDERSIAERGLCIRHLVLPNGQSASLSLLDFLRQTFDPQEITISLMAQYRPLYKASFHPLVREHLDPKEYETVKTAFLTAGFGGFFQELEKLDSSFVIDFKTRKEEPLMGA